ncbi:hypothetical protein Poli38472_013088 [Pythium oligandrum]|uniref:VWFD domain-containing protein n=1 Tax=Pythium oligandrum TaxID=41045 RepID=A0A8K1C2Z3_PYTOL|nr:hypothetical protein Poli38472_013088 [Pythium oligandrum]|eukprot:TMW55197.1 hypothetical protein Poli38472_013088 [Pythium oligandrum]
MLSIKSLLQTTTMAAALLVACATAGTQPGTVKAAGGNLVEIEIKQFDDGAVAEALVTVTKEYFGRNPAFDVKVNIPGVKCEQDTFHVKKNCTKTGKQWVKCKPIGCPKKAKNGDVIDVPVTFEYTINDGTKREKETQVVKRCVKNCGSCSGQGDPHIITFDGVAYDLHKPGVYNYFESGPLKIQVFQDHCNTKPMPGSNDPPGCYKGVAIAYADSVARFYLENNSLKALKGSDALEWLDIKEMEGPTEAYRVFLKVDSDSYVDVTTGNWDDYMFVNVALHASSFLRREGAKGLMGNWNDNPDDDEKNPEKVAEMYKIDIADNLLTCSDCTKFLTEPGESDIPARNLSTPLDLYQQGYAPVTGLAKKEIKPVVTPLPGKSRRMAEDEYGAESKKADDDEYGAASKKEDDYGSDGQTNDGYASEKTTAPPATKAPVTEKPASADKAAKLCKQVLSSIPHCAEYVDHPQFYIDVCEKDVNALGRFCFVDITKLSYLRECRRTLDSLILSQTCAKDENSKIVAHRKELNFGDLTMCKDNCNGKGDCLAAGCKCQKGYTGFACEVKI